MIDTILERDIIYYNKARLRAFRDGYVLPTNQDYENILSSRYHKVSRVKQHLVYMIMKRKYHYFITFTFDDDYIQCCDRTKRDAVKKAIKSINADVLYIMNIDFGSKTEREHFHVLLGTDSPTDLVSHFSSEYPCFFKVMPIYLSDRSITKISKYINKLSNHCIKDSTRNRRIVYNFKGYDKYPPPLNRMLFIEDCDCLGL